jgi:transcriptional regulator with XRE-family HTH domain
MAEGPRRQPYEAFGAYVRSQRDLAQLSLRQAAQLARISNPYLSQIEHGLTLPSVTVLSALANALQVSADALLLRAAGAATGETDRAATATEHAIRHDERLDEVQKRALLAVLSSYVGTPPRPETPATGNGAAPTAKPASRRRRTPKTPAPGEGIIHA